MTIDSPKPRRLICDAICQAVPAVTSAETEDLDAEDLLKDVLELDSTDFFTIATEISERSGVEIPKRDYVHMETLGAFEDYLRERLGAVEG